MTEYIMEIQHDVVNGTYSNIKREEIVRCMDCAFYVRDPEPIDPGWPMMCEDTGRDMVEPNGFCAWGERKKVE